MIRNLVAAALVACAALAPAAAQEKEDAFDFAGDVFRAGGSAVFAGPEAHDAFLAGERVELSGPITGSAHLAGRRIEVTGAIGGDLYAFGADVRLAAPVAGAAAVAGYDVAVEGAVGGNLRAAGAHVEVKAPVGGGALLTGGRVDLAAPVAGDARITSDDIVFGEGARVDGTLTLVQEAGREVEVPASVAPPERIARQVATGHGMIGMAGPGWFAIIAGLLLGVVVLAVLAMLAPTIAPHRTERLRLIAGEAPFRTLGAGFLALSALLGSAVLLALTLIGIVVAPVALVAAGILGTLGYIVAVYLLGTWMLTRAGGLVPDTFPEYALAGVVGAVVATLLSLLPFVGWFVMLALTLVGAGAIAISIVRPRDERVR
ncbi:hypothetical protein [Amaricoccus sp.]|uniref:hypothetical protein n=1 Tax=Amaricoccus sp. TaxID=1872485 RepID=UPI001B42F573|nr:hypothetical protein [Amaricoccus sp.]MBP7001444.1 hypothetical protein [Amaricoccus sp.]